MKGIFKATWWKGSKVIYSGKSPDEADSRVLIIEIEEVTPKSMKLLKESLEEFGLNLPEV